MRYVIIRALLLLGSLLLLVGCATSPAATAPTATPEAATATPQPPTATPEAATATPESSEAADDANASATATPQPPTATPAPPTATPENLYLGLLQTTTDAGVPVLGDPAAPIVLTDYSDFMCPACQRYVLAVEPQIVETYVQQGQVQLRFRPVLNHEERSLITSEAAECAHQQGQFWPMHDLLFARLDQHWAVAEAELPALMRSYAAELGLDEAAFAACQEAGTAREQVIALDAEQRQRGITLQPTFEINQQRLVGFQPYTVFQNILDAQLAEGQ